MPIIYYYILLLLILLNIFLHKIKIIKNYVSIFCTVQITESLYIDSDMLWFWYDRSQVAKACLKTDKQIFKNLSALTLNNSALLSQERKFPLRNFSPSVYAKGFIKLWLHSEFDLFLKGSPLKYSTSSAH